MVDLVGKVVDSDRVPDSGMVDLGKVVDSDRVPDLDREVGSDMAVASVRVDLDGADLVKQVSDRADLVKEDSTKTHLVTRKEGYAHLFDQTVPSEAT